jgi:hypothetical protein
MARKPLIVNRIILFIAGKDTYISKSNYFRFNHEGFTAIYKISFFGNTLKYVGSSNVKFL